MTIKLRVMTYGEHSEVRLFMGPDADHLALTGTMMFREVELFEFLNTMQGKGTGTVIIERGVFPNEPAST